MTITLSSSANAAIDQMFNALAEIVKKGAAACLILRHLGVALGKRDFLAAPQG